LARTQIIAKQISIVFASNQKLEAGKKKTGDNQPPKKHIATITDSHIILEYSARKNIAKVIPAYSTLYPATISASASGKSKGALLVSASTEIKKTMPTGSKGTINHTDSCWRTISIKLNEFAQAATGSKSNDIETSYDINCAAERSPPRNAYFELLVQPAPIIA
jgi:hypothetical protein